MSRKRRQCRRHDGRAIVDAFCSCHLDSLEVIDDVGHRPGGLVLLGALDCTLEHLSMPTKGGTRARGKGKGYACLARAAVTDLRRRRRILARKSEKYILRSTKYHIFNRLVCIVRPVRRKKNTKILVSTVVT